MGMGQSLLFGAGQLGVMLLARFFFQWLIRFADQGDDGQSLFDPAAVGLLFFGFRLFDGVTDPIAGSLSDAWVRRGRERRTLLWFSFLLPPIGLALVFAPHATMPQGVRWTLLALGMFLFFVGYTLYAIPYWSLIDDYSRGADAVRARLSTVLGVTLLFATALGFVLSPDLVERYGFFTASLAFALPAAGLMVLPYFAAPKAPARRRPEPDVSPHAPATAGFLVALKHRRFLATIALFSGSQMSFTVLTSAVPYIAVELLGGQLSDQKWLLGPFIGAAIPCFAFVPHLTQRLGWQPLVVAASWGLGAVYAGTGMLGAGLIGSPLTTASLVFACGGPMAAVLLALEGEAVTSCAREREGEVTSIYFGVYNLVVKGLNGLALYFTGLLAAAVPVQGLWAVRAMGWLAGGCLAVGVLAYLALKPARAGSPA